MRIAIVGSGIAGLACAHLLDNDQNHSDRHNYEVTLYEADERLGGHTNTVTVDDPSAGPLGVDTGFIVHNDRNYPNLLRLFDRLNVPTQDSEMSFSVTDSATGFTYRATNVATMLAKPRNAVDPRMWRMLVDVARFYRRGARFLDNPDPTVTIADFLRDGGYSDTFIDLHLLPMGAAVWSTSPADFGRFPATALLTFLRNHGLLGIGDRPQWRTVVGGSQRYVTAITDRFGGKIRLGTPVLKVTRSQDETTGDGTVLVATKDDVSEFDRVIMACHSDQALAMIAEPTPLETKLLGDIPYVQNTAVLHTDTSVLSPAGRAWAAWNYHAAPDQSQPVLTYDMTTLQRLPGAQRYLVSLNPDPDHPLQNVLGRYRYAHPQFTAAAVAAQERVDEIDGVDRLYFCGAYWGYGFHEDGMASAVRVCRKLGVTW
jgi:predicted NAD/FAD-binding protein